MVTERWGRSGRCRHAGTAEFQLLAGGEVVVKFDLSALPKRTRIYRARLLMTIQAGPRPLPRPVLIQPVTASIRGQGPPKLEPKPLPLLPPRFRSFDATDVARRWVSGKLANHGLCIRNGPRGHDRLRTYLEITYEGRLKDPPPPVEGLRAFHRAGQVFLTWREVRCPFAGKEEVSWAEMKALQARMRAGKLPEVSYRIYRHSRPIDARTIAQAELLDEVPQLSVFDERMIQTQWKGERIKNVRVASARVPRYCVRAKEELPVGTGAYVRTSDTTRPTCTRAISATSTSRGSTAPCSTPSGPSSPPGATSTCSGPGYTN